MKFRTTILSGGKTTTGIEVPAEVVEALGQGKKPPVKVTINGGTYRSSIAVMAGKYMVGVSAENRAVTKVTGGDVVDVEIEFDDAPREVALPPDFARALAGDPAAQAAFDELSFSRKRGLVEPIAAIKGAEARERRIDKTLATLRESKK